MTIEKVIDKILDHLHDESFTAKNGARVVPFETVKQYLINLQLNTSISDIIDKSVTICFTVPVGLVDILKADTGAYIRDYIVQRISYRGIKDERLRYYELKDKIEKALKHS